MKQRENKTTKMTTNKIMETTAKKTILTIATTTTTTTTMTTKTTEN